MEKVAKASSPNPAFAVPMPMPALRGQNKRAVAKVASELIGRAGGQAGSRETVRIGFPLGLAPWGCVHCHIS